VFGGVEAITDRLCIATGGKVKFQFSAEDVLSCCTDCGDGCDGGYPYSTWTYWINSGIVSGGDYQSQQVSPFRNGTKNIETSLQGCQPYTKSAFVDNTTPECANTCLNTNYTISYQQDKHFGVDHYSIAEDVEQIQTEILTNGPVEASYSVYGDFYSYDSGTSIITTFPSQRVLF
jgi:cathepsin B